jgi:hypothetical protein
MSQEQARVTEYQMSTSVAIIEIETVHNITCGKYNPVFDLIYLCALV